MMLCCGMAVKRMGMLGVSVRKMKTLAVKLETVALTGEGRWNLPWLYVLTLTLLMCRIG